MINKINNSLTLILLSLSVAFAQQTLNSPTVDGSTVSTTAASSVATDGFNDQDANLAPQHQSWLQQNDRYIFIIVLAILVAALVGWYIFRSIRGVRQKLTSDNKSHLMMVQNISGGRAGNFPETVPVDMNGFHKMPDYPDQPKQNQQQQYAHRY